MKILFLFIMMILSNAYADYGIEDDIQMEEDFMPNQEQQELAHLEEMSAEEMENLPVEEEEELIE